MYKNEQKREFQRGLDPEAGKTKRQEDRLLLRRQIREELLTKRRKALTGEYENLKSSENSKSAMDATGSNKSKTGSTNGESKDEKDENVESGDGVENLSSFVEQVKSGKLEPMTEGVKGIRQLVCREGNIPIGKIFESDVISDLLKILQTKIEVKDWEHRSLEEQAKCNLQFETAWALTNVASGEKEYTRQLAEMGCVEAFAAILRNSRDLDTLDQVIAGLGNIVGDSVDARDKALQ
ncbi:importin alpha 1 subunit-like protein, partial [Reticulomyxa filosa]